jgi:hypothetical protein
MACTSVVLPNFMHDSELNKKKMIVFVWFIVQEKVADVLTLAKWYWEGENYAKPVVVMIDDMERCNADVLGNFINMLR